MTTLDVLKAARALISDPARWTWFAYARYSKGGRRCSPLNSLATCWCGVGAIRKVTNDNRSLAPHALAALDQDGSMDTSDVNDWQGHAEILARYDRTIARLESEAAA